MENEITKMVIEEMYERHKSISLRELQTIIFSCELYQKKLDDKLKMRRKNHDKKLHHVTT